jgi:transcriptional regulator with GAF, ATPase, and Fis domain
VNLVAPTNSTVLLTGPTGTGKELFARALHAAQRRHARLARACQLRGAAATLVESELFGHEKGAFTGAVAPRQDGSKLADGGTIFLDEIGICRRKCRSKFLRVLQEGEFERVGSSRTRQRGRPRHCRDASRPRRRCRRGPFRADLYYRLRCLSDSLPSRKSARRTSASGVVPDQPSPARAGTTYHGRATSVMRALQQHTWPGNVRELDNVIETRMIGSSGGVLQLDESFMEWQAPARGR